VLEAFDITLPFVSCDQYTAAMFTVFIADNSGPLLVHWKTQKHHYFRMSFLNIEICSGNGSWNAEAGRRKDVQKIRLYLYSSSLPCATNVLSALVTILLQLRCIYIWIYFISRHTSCAAVFGYFIQLIWGYLLFGFFIYELSKTKLAVSIHCRHVNVEEMSEFFCWKKFVKFIPSGKCMMKTMTMMMCCGPNLIMFIDIIKMARNLSPQGPANDK
jgi:hypothetical protein